MTDVPKHDTEQEGESHASEVSWVHFFIEWYAIGIDYLLEDTCKLIGFYEGRRLDFGVRYLYDLELNLF